MKKQIEYNGATYTLLAQRPAYGLGLYTKADPFAGGPVLLGTAPVWAPMEVDPAFARRRFDCEDGWVDADGEPVPPSGQAPAATAQQKEYIGQERASQLTALQAQLVASALNMRIAVVGEAPLATPTNLAMYGLQFAIDGLEKLAGEQEPVDAATTRRLIGRLKAW
jgi:hypothetical protein